MKVDLLHFSLLLSREIWVLKMPSFTKPGFLLENTSYRVINGTEDNGEVSPGKLGKTKYKANVRVIFIN